MERSEQLVLWCCALFCLGAVTTLQATGRIRPPRPSPALPAPVVPAPAPVPTSPVTELVQVSRGLPSAGQWRHQGAVVDLDGDGHLDVVFGPARKGRAAMSVWLGDGAGGFHPWEQARFDGPALEYGAVAAADLDGDGRVDLVLGAHYRGVLAFLQRAPGVFTATTTGLPWGEQAPFSSRAVAVDRGTRSVVALSDGPRGQPGLALGVRAFGWNGSGFSAGAVPTPDPGAFGDGIAVADVTGDGTPDLLLAQGRPVTSGLLWAGTGVGFESVTLRGLNGDVYVRGVAAGDLDGDGTDELVAATTRGVGNGAVSVVWVWKGPVSSETLPLSWAFPSGMAAPWSVAVDAAHHIAVGLDDGSVQVLEATGGQPRLVARVTPEEQHRGCPVFWLRAARLLDDTHAEQWVVGQAGDDVATCASGGGLSVWAFPR